jgi:hypothetical protein
MQRRRVVAMALRESFVKAILRKICVLGVSEVVRTEGLS